MSWKLPLGANVTRDGVEFRVWAPDRQQVEVVVYANGGPAGAHALTKDADGYWSGVLADLGAGSRYMYRLDGRDDRPDPASRAQPDGVHGPSMVVDPAFGWSDDGWRGVPMQEMVIYEAHVGAATPSGLFEALIGRLADLRELGVTALEVMPIGDFPGNRNWGYDGVALYAPARAYGGAAGFKRLIDAAHRIGLAVILDVVYNHLGPDGNYLREFSQDYFTDRHQTPWGDALNYDGPGSAAVREFFIENALYWAHEYHVDGLRLDATHAIVDEGPVHFLRELPQRVRESLPHDRHFVLIAEDGRNDAQLLRSPDQDGFGLDAVWADDFHHTVRVTLTDEDEGYYSAYKGGPDEIVATLSGGWLYQGQYSEYQGQPWGTPAADLQPSAFVHTIQNHDQIGNRAGGERLHHDVPLSAYRAASALLLLSPYTPLLFMGQEWAATSPFLYFTDHTPELGRLVTEGRRKEFEHFTDFAGEEVPDPQAIETFERSKLNWAERTEGLHEGVLRLYRDLLELRRTHPACRNGSRQGFRVRPVEHGAIVMLREPSAGQAGAMPLLVAVNLRGTTEIDLSPELSSAPHWELAVDTDDTRYRVSSSEEDEEQLGPPYTAGRTITLAGPRAVVLRGVVSPPSS